MATTTFQTRPHTSRPGDVIEVWHGDQFIATITASGTHPGISVITKHRVAVSCDLNQPKAGAVWAAWDGKGTVIAVDLAIIQPE